MSDSPKSYSLKKKTVEIPIEQEDGSTSTYVLKELSGAQRNQYLNTQNKKMSASGKSDVQIKDFTGLCSDLLVLCLYKPPGVSVTAKEVDDWPSDMQLDIYRQAIKLSGLDKKAEDEEKNA